MQDTHHRNRLSRDRRQIESWEKVREVVNETSERGNLPLGLTVSIERPIFTNGDIGYNRVNATITVGNYYVRLATRAIIDLLDILAEHRGKILDAVDEVRDANDQRDREKSKARRSNHTKPKDRIPVAQKDLPLLDDSTLNRARGRYKTRRSHGRSSPPKEQQG